MWSNLIQLRFIIDRYTPPQTHTSKSSEKLSCRSFPTSANLYIAFLPRFSFLSQHFSTIPDRQTSESFLLPSGSGMLQKLRHDENGDKPMPPYTSYKESDPLHLTRTFIHTYSYRRTQLFLLIDRRPGRSLLMFFSFVLYRSLRHFVLGHPYRSYIYVW